MSDERITTIREAVPHKFIRQWSNVHVEGCLGCLLDEIERDLAERDEALRKVKEAAVWQWSEWMHFHEVAMAEPFKAESEALAFAIRVMGILADFDPRPVSVGAEETER